MLFIEEYKQSEESVETEYKFVQEKYEEITTLFKNVSEANIDKLESDIEFIESMIDSVVNSHWFLIQTMYDEVYALNNRTVEYLFDIDKEDEIKKILKTNKSKERKEERLKLYKLYQKKFDELWQNIEKIELEKRKIKDKLIEDGYIRKKGIFTEKYEEELQTKRREEIREIEERLKEEFEQEI